MNDGADGTDRQRGLMLVRRVGQRDRDTDRQASSIMWASQS